MTFLASPVLFMASACFSKFSFQVTPVLFVKTVGAIWLSWS